MATPSTLSYERLSFEVKLKGGDIRRLVDDVSVEIKAGEVLAILGPSGAGKPLVRRDKKITNHLCKGKSTLLELMSFRRPSLEGGSVRLNGQILSKENMHKISALVDQEDALFGALTVRESVEYSLRLHSPFLKRKDVSCRVNNVIATLGLSSCQDQKIGSALSRGISHGQKRRTAAACAMVTYPRILFLDEVTSGLDSTAAREVIASIKNLAISEGMIVLAAIHQPSSDTLSHFTNLLLLSGGKMCYGGPVDGLRKFFSSWGHPVSHDMTPTEHALNFLNNDFEYSDGSKPADAYAMQHFYLNSWSNCSDGQHGFSFSEGASKLILRDRDVQPMEAMFWNTLVLSERTVKYYVRNLLSYPMRACIFGCSGLLVATIWIQLSQVDSAVKDRLAVHFFAVAYLALSSMAVVPSYLEERAVYYRETKNGLYSTLPFMVSNMVVNAPFLFGCATIYTLICYWAIELHPGVTAFFRYLGLLFLVVFVAESQTIFLSSMVPYLVPALTLSAFANSFWLSLSGFFISSRNLPRFWHDSFHRADYMKYAFELLSHSDFRGITFQCQQRPDGSCLCIYPSSTSEACTVSGDDILINLGIGPVSFSRWAGYLVVIGVVCRILMYVALKCRSK